MAGEYIVMIWDYIAKHKTRIACAILVLSIVYFFAGVADNATLLSVVAMENPIWYGIRQLLVIIIVYMLGFLALNLIEGISEKWHLLLSFPVGMTCWVMTGYLELIIGIPYRLVGTLSFSYGVLVLIHILTKRPLKTIGNEKNLIVFLLTAAFLAASGLNYIFRSFDTYFFFTNYGHALSAWGTFDNFVGERVYVFNQIGQFFPILNSLASLMGLDQGFQMVVFAGYNFVLIFGFSLFEIIKADEKQQKNKVVFVCLATLLLLTSTCFIIGTRWILANMYCMFFIFIIVVLTAMQIEKNEEISHSAAVWIIGILGAGLGILRKDGIIFMTFLIISMGAVWIYSRKELLCMYLPAAFTEGLWVLFVKVIIGTRDLGRYVRYGSTTIASNKNVLFIIAIITTGIAYILFGRNILKFIEDKTKYLTQYWIMLAVLVLLIVPCIKKKEWLIFDNFDYTVRNLFGRDSAWGLSAYILVAIIVMSMIPKFKLDFENFVWIGYMILNFVSYSIIDDKVLWVNWDDSYSRVLMQIVPVCVWVCMYHIWNNAKTIENGTGKK